MPSKRNRKHHSRRNWLKEHESDGFVRQARKEGYRARSAYKLADIDARDKLIRPGLRIIDLGAAPGGWCQYIARKCKGSGVLVAVDLLPVEAIAGVLVVQGDFEDSNTRTRIAEVAGSGPFDLVLSDMAPNISGIAAADQARAMGLAEGVLHWAAGNLAEQGSLLIKVFQGAGFDALRQEMTTMFSSVVVRKPRASRSRSAEVYLLGRGFRPAR